MTDNRLSHDSARNLNASLNHSRAPSPALLMPAVPGPYAYHRGSAAAAARSEAHAAQTETPIQGATRHLMHGLPSSARPSLDEERRQHNQHADRNYVMTPDMVRMLVREAQLANTDSTVATLSNRGARTAAPSDDEKVDVLEKERSVASFAAETTVSLDEPVNPLMKFKQITREFWAEFFGTAILIIFGTGVNHQVVLASSPAVVGSDKGIYLTISFGWGVGVMMGVYVSGGISGGHINPAVTLALATFRGFQWKKVPVYICAQLLGAFFGAAVVYLNYSRAISLFEGGYNVRTISGPTSTGALFFTAPLEYMSAAGCWYNEFVDTCILLMVILAIGDSGNIPPPAGMNPFILLWLIFGLGATMGSQTAYAMNPARDIGPRFLCWLVGYGHEVWTVRNWYWLWCPTLAPIMGALVGSAIYDGLLGSPHPDSPLSKPWGQSWRLPSFMRRRQQAIPR